MHSQYAGAYLNGLFDLQSARKASERALDQKLQPCHMCGVDSRQTAIKRKTMAEIGEPEKRRILIPNETEPTPQVTPERREPAKVPAKEPA
jgi:hypothetical protein